jgi:hypothetical protein
VVDSALRRQHHNQGGHEWIWQRRVARPTAEALTGLGFVALVLAALVWVWWILEHGLWPRP